MAEARTVSRAAPRIVRVVGAALALVSASPARADDSMPTPVDGLADDTVRAFSGASLLYFGAAVASTAILVPSGGDHAVRLAVQHDLHSQAWGDSAVYGGYVAPVVIPLGLWLGGLAAEDHALAGAGSAAAQALVVTEVTVALLKVGTGRPFPANAGSDVPQARDDQPAYSRDFSPFGFGGRYAWPSGHTSAAFSIASALTAYAGDSVVVPLVAYPLATGIAAGMLVGDHHWASDVLAGGLFGQAIGWSVGRSFRERAHRGEARAARFQLVPIVGGGVTGCAAWLEL